MVPPSFAARRGTAAVARLACAALARAVPPLAFFSSSGPVAAPAGAKAPAGPPPMPPASHPHPDAGRFPLAFLSEATYLPHPDKVAEGGCGDDAWAMTAHALAVADGVGGWSEDGIDPGVYARRLMAETERLVRCAAADMAASASASAPASGGGQGGGVDVDPKAVLFHAWRATREKGSATALLVTATHRGTLRVCNLGDSGAMLLRQERPPVTDHAPAPLRAEEAAKLWRVLTATSPLTHSFNFPKQLAASRASDSLASAQLGELTGAGPGDVMLLASDGLFDNLHDAQITSLLGRVSWAPCHEYVRLKRRRYTEAQGVEAAVQAEAARAAAGGRGGGAAAAAPRGTPLERFKIRNVPSAGFVTDAELADAERGCRAALSSASALLAVSAQRVGANFAADSPFAASARAEGRRARSCWKGGKLDDCVVVLGLVVPDDAAPRVDGGAEAGVGGSF